MALHSIKAKILWSVLPIVMTLSIASTTISVYQQMQSMERDLKRIGMNAVRNLADNAELGLYSQNSAFLRPALQALSSDQSFAYAVVYNQNNEVLDAKLSAGMVMDELKVIPPSVLSDLNQQSEPVWRSISVHGEDMYEFLLPVIASEKNHDKNNDESIFLEDTLAPDASVKKNSAEETLAQETSAKEISAKKISGRRIGYVRYGENLKDFRATLRLTILENLLILSLFFSASFVFILILAFRITKPIEQLAKLSAAVSGGDLEQRINVIAKDEVGKLAMSFNRMVAAVKERDGELRTAHAELEQRVAERTRELTLLNQSLSDEVAERIKVEEHLEHTATILAAKAEDLERSNKELDQFAYIAAHDLKAPLRAIANLSNWIEEDMKGKLSGETAEHMRLLHGRVQRLDRLIEGILHYSRLGKPNTQDFAQVNTEELVHHVVEMLSPPPGFTITMTTPMPELQCTRLFFEQVMSNLISNAIKYRARDNGRVEISVREVGDYFEFSVADDGPGIEPQYHEKIFVIFQTLNARDDVESTGIGLAIVKKIVEKQGGKVTVKSAIGQGAKFIFTWPKSPAFAKQSATLEDKRQETGNLGRRVAPHLPNS